MPNSYDPFQLPKDFQGDSGFPPSDDYYEEEVTVEAVQSQPGAAQSQSSMAQRQTQQRSQTQTTQQVAPTNTGYPQNPGYPQSPGYPQNPGYPQGQPYSQVPNAYQQDINQAQQQAAPGAPVIIIHNDNNNTNTNTSQTQTAQTQVAQQVAPVAAVVKSKWVAFWLCFFLGAFGAQYFYVGYIGKGFLMLALTFFGFGLLVTLPWAVVNLIQILMGTFRVNGGYPI